VVNIFQLKTLKVIAKYTPEQIEHMISKTI